MSADNSEQVNLEKMLVGSKLEYELDYTQISETSDWIELCHNTSLVPKYNVSVKAIVVNDDGEEFRGPYSDSVTIQHSCTG